MNVVSTAPLSSPINPRRLRRVDLQIAILAASACLLIAGMLSGSPALVGAGAAGLCLLARVAERLAASPRSNQLVGLAARLLDKCGRYNVSGELVATDTPPQPEGDPPPRREPAVPLPKSIESPDDLVTAMIATNRYALLLALESQSHLSEDERDRVMQTLDEQMAIVPAGAVLTGVAAEHATLGVPPEDLPTNAGQSSAVQVESFHLDRRPVTNGQFQQFVDSGGYEQLDLWPEEALPAMLGFVDATGAAAPRFWRDGQHTPGDERLPVVGVSWYEAVAYARWVGKRLPSDAEWTKAAAWPIESSSGHITQRRYPWGEAFESHRANLAAGGRQTLAPVDDFAAGVTVGGVDQMIGNAWEWTCDTLDDATPSAVRFPLDLRSLRGGAFNTYFENQATCHFQSGEDPLARRPNIGVRLAFGVT